MATFNGYLIRSTQRALPNEYIKFDSYSSTPNQREEIKAYRDEVTRELFRYTAEGMKTKITFTTRQLHKSQKEDLLAFFTESEVNAVERKVFLIFWDDENATYKSGYFYRPNMEFKIKQIVKNGNSYDIIYQELSFELIEY